VTVATWRVNRGLLEALLSRPVAIFLAVVAVAGVAGAFLGLSRERDLATFIGSSAFLAGLSTATAACVFPVMLRAVPDPALSMTAFNSGGDPAGLKTALRWLLLGLPLALFYFVVVFRLHRGKAEASPEGQGY
jgi:cytochrome d ubiquinol oxidase subunit II